MTAELVRAELQAGTETHPYLERAVTVLDDGMPVVAPTPTARELEEQLRETLDPGEAQAVAVAEAAGGTVVTDDGDARATAKRRDVVVTGSIGLLVRFVEDGAIAAPTADAYLKRWIDEAGFRSPTRDIEVFLAK